MWIATVITAHGLTLFAWWLRLCWQAQQEHAHRQDLIALARALPDGGQIHEGHSDGTWTRLAVTRAGDDDRDHG
jgi:hypothetical protein